MSETRTKKYMCETCTQDIYSSQQPPPRRAPFSNHVCSFIPVPDVRCIPREIEVLSEGAIHPVELTLKDYIHANYICDDYDLPRGGISENGRRRSPSLIYVKVWR